MATKKRQIPNKLYFRIGEVSEIVGVKAYVLRYWETEFPDVRPTKSKSGQRLYKRRDVELLLQVRDLLYDERYTIDGAKQRLRELMRLPREVHAAPTATEVDVDAHDGEFLEDDLHAADSLPEPQPVQATPAPRNGSMATTPARPLDQQGKKLLLKIRTDLVNMLGELRTE